MQVPIVSIVAVALAFLNLETVAQTLKSKFNVTHFFAEHVPNTRTSV